MLSVSLSFKPINFDDVKYTKTLDRVAGQIFRESVREWLRAVLTSVSGSFPVVTGTAKSTLVPLGRFLRNVGGLQVNPTKSQKGKGPGVGQAASDFEIIDDRNAPGTLNYQFNWSNSIEHYFINEFFKASHIKTPTIPWFTTAAGQRAWEISINQRTLARLPKMTDFFTLC